MTEEEISIENMAEAYLDERKMDLENMMIQVRRLEEHIANCEKILVDNDQPIMSDKQQAHPPREWGYPGLSPFSGDGSPTLILSSMQEYRVNYKITKHGVLSYEDVMASDELQAEKMCVNSIVSSLIKNNKCGCISYKGIVKVISWKP